MYYLCPAFDEWSDARVAEEARLESVYTSKAYPEFESRSLRKKAETIQVSAFFVYSIFDDYALFRIKLMSMVTSLTFSTPSPFMSA